MLEIAQRAGKFVGGASAFLGASLGVGAACGLAAELLGRDVSVWFFFGLFLPVGPLYFWFSSARVVRQRLVWYQSLREAKLITPHQHARLRNTLVDWYIRRQFGRDDPDTPSDHKPDSSTPAPPAMTRIVVVGAGLSGLAAAFRIRQVVPAAHLTLLEANTRPGGNVWTEHLDGYTVEHGPNGLFDAKPHALRLCRDLGLGDELVPGSEDARKNRFLFVGGRMRQLPGGPLGVLTTPILSPLGRLRLLTEPFRRRPAKVPADESVAAFARRRFGREAADTFLDGLVTGVHAGDPERLSLAAAFPRMAAFERDAGSVVRGMMRAVKQRKRDALARGETPGPQRMWSFRDGLKVLIDALTDALAGSVRLGVPATRIERTPAGWLVHGDGADRWPADVVVLTSPAHRQAETLADLDPALAAEFAGVRSNRIAVVALGYRRADVTGRQDGFGYIAPQATGRDVLGVQWCSSVFAGRAPQGCVLWRALCGGVRRADVFDWDDDTLGRRVHDEMRATTGVTAAPVFRRVVRWPRAIPQYQVGHLARVRRIEDRAADWPGLILGGNSLHGVALNDCCEQAEQIAERVRRHAHDPAATAGLFPSR